MSTWIHCNHCFIVPTNDCNKVRFWFTSCGHLLCAECLKAKRSNNNNNGQHFECLLCHQQNVQLVELNRHLRPELLALFRPAKDLIDEFNAKLKQVLTFQQSHQKRLVDHLTDKVDRTTKTLRPPTLRSAAEAPSPICRRPRSLTIVQWAAARAVCRRSFPGALPTARAAHCAALFHHSQRTRQHRNRFVWLLISVQKTK
ncbi:hypothetical protein niasHT_014399 [Heterodera trifolii]|uniref:RING-type domain-containing protein n=1 Tax=Heterodera trifolii TaxID=157864 RepID=A0ABD2LH91_9BILA